VIDIRETIREMSLDEKVGQMFMANICGGETLEVAKRNFEEFRFGGLQFSGVFERFIRGGHYMPCGVCENTPLAEVAEFLARIKQAAIDITGVPVIMGGDQEGGIRSSIFRRRNVTIMPTQMALGASGSPEDTYRAASVTAREVKALGLDMLYGPALDVNTNPRNPEIGVRSFGQDPHRVAELGEQVIRAYAAHNVISAAKHFPGRGQAASDSHHELESIELDRAHLESVELVPFRRAIAAGVDALMMAHARFPALESEPLPASLSPRIMRFIREELGFGGLIIPDTLTMFAISKHFDVPRACAMCLEAGADMVFMKVQQLYRPAIEAIKESVRAGRLTEERINESLQRILKLKLKRGLFDGPQFSKERLAATVGCLEHVQAAREIARRCVLVLKNEGQAMPLSTEKNKSVLVIVPRAVDVIMSNDPVLSHEMLPRAIGRHASDVRHIVVDESPTEVQAFEAVALAKNADTLIFGVYSGAPSREHMALLDSLLELGKPVIVVLADSPYVASELPEKVRGVLCTFGIAPCTFEASAEVIFGKLAPSARLPVAISESMPGGFALEIS